MLPPEESDSMGFTTSESVSVLRPPDQAEESASGTAEVTPRPPQPLPSIPLTVIEASRSWVALDLRELWAHRELLYFLMWRDVKVRYKQTALGAAWAIIQPLFTMLIFTLFFGKLAGIPSDGVPYPLFAFA